MNGVNSYHEQRESFRDVVIEGDSKAVISKLSSENTDYSEISALIWEAKGKARGLHACTYQHIHRSDNKAAHLLATMHNHDEDDRFWIEEAPRAVEDKAAEDRHGLEPSKGALSPSGWNVNRFYFALLVFAT
ncbi:uncharacterized protein LOC120213762 isoform X1 [Hibiscus syriacus]|uniref:uncharacterized protein LOC120213762 isoform X1 n=1 Tax=Hibiscus syriacus TaxID=106335 RepID=UPI001924699E|nr:uncharacterized protein LOC120213762 isoform X1 [Hibiscus syriacus]